MNSLDLKYYFAVFWRRLPWFLAVAGLITGLGISVAILLPPTYRSSASILVESQQITEDLANPTVQVTAIEVIQVIRQRLMTRQNLLDIAAEFDVFRNEPDLTASQKVDRMRNATDFRQTSFGTDRRPGANSFTVSFTDRNPRRSADVTNQFVTLILQENAEIRTGRATNTTEFFRQQVEDLSAELTQLEAEILEFKEINKDALPESLGFRRDQLAVLQEQRLRLEREETQLVERLDELEQAKENPDLIALTNSAPRTPLEREIAELEQALVRQQAVYSDVNPRIIALKARIAALQETLLGSETGPNGEDPAQLQILRQIGDAQERLDEVQTQKDSVSERIAILNETIRATPANEMQLNILNRRYSGTTSQFNTARAKLAAANQGERIELQRQGERFSVIEQATVSDRPISPNRPIIATGAAAAGIAAGLGLIVLLEFLTPAVRRPVDISRKLNIPVFETVPLIRTAGERRRRAIIWGCVAVTLAVSMIASVWAIHTYYLPLDLILNKIWGMIGLGSLFG